MLLAAQKKITKLLRKLGTYFHSRYPVEQKLKSCAKKSTPDFVFRPKMAIFRMAGMRDGELPLPPAFQYFQNAKTLNLEVFNFIS